MATNSFVNPSSLSLPSSSTDTSRKRPRTNLTPEDRKEARAHRKRIAAQNSRDKRKAQFSTLEKRVAELEEENRQLRAGLRVSEPLKPEEQKAWEKENNELKDRIKTLEKGWDAVVKALAAQGLTTGVVANEPTSTTTTFPVLVPPSTTFPISPPPSHSSLSSSSFFADDFDFDSTRHSARVATIEAPPPSMSLQRVDSHLHRISSLTFTPIPHPRRRHPRLSTTRPWKSYSAKSSSLRLPCRRRLFLWTPSKTRHRWPPQPCRRS